MTALQAELTKLRSVRSTTWALLIMAGLMIVFAVVSASTSSTEGIAPANPAKNEVVVISLAGVYVAQVAAIALGVGAICGEYGTGTIRATFAANPRRRQVLAAKAATVGALVLAVGAVATLAAFFIGQPILRTNGYTADNGYPAASLADGTTLRTLAISALYLVVVAVLGLGVGTIVRHAVTAVSVLLSVLFVPFIIGPLFSDHLGHAIESASPMVGFAAQEQGAPIGVWTGVGVTVAWATAAWAIALWSIARRDA